MSRDIHDTIAQSVSSIGMLARSALESGDPAQSNRALEQIGALAAEGLADARRIVNALMPAELESTAPRRRPRPDAGAPGRRDRDQEATLHAMTTCRRSASTSRSPLLRTAQSASPRTSARTHPRRASWVTLADAGDAVRLDIVDDGSASRRPGGMLRAVVGGQGRRVRAALDARAPPRTRRRTRRGERPRRRHRALGATSRSAARCRRDGTGATDDSRCTCCSSTITRSSGPGCARCSITATTSSVVGEAASGEEAVVLARHLHPDVVLCDLRLGEAWTACRRPPRFVPRTRLRPC